MNWGHRRSWDFKAHSSSPIYKYIYRTIFFVSNSRTPDLSMKRSPVHPECRLLYQAIFRSVYDFKDVGQTRFNLTVPWVSFADLASNQMLSINVKPVFPELKDTKGVPELSFMPG